jgi:hypothetical protein
MDHRSDIWRRLQDHSIPPPAEAVDRLRDEIHRMQQMTEQPPAGDLERLRQHEMQPPPFLHTTIKGSIADSRRRRNVLVYGSVAACFLLVVAGIMIYKMGSSSKPTPPAAGQNTIASAPIRPAGGASADSIAQMDTATADLSSTTPNTTATVRTIMIDRFSSVSIKGHSLPLVDNDLLITFTSFKYPGMADYITRNGDQAMKVYVDQYTNINISKNVVGMMKVMYETRSNGKPTRKARRMKARLESWKKADERRFDGPSKPDPVDPIDLAEFIFR